ncbi:DUF4174 domain-containing protein [Heliomarina baculiformis]|uniref:DUF4174 domain-containing protein n=1 Tax=Heliomarina baculiformis TaxID=2872036 RepID=UPI001EE23B70|nr:DUF4174 domain-containing protein [Heliomarina baculiformis]
MTTRISKFSRIGAASLFGMAAISAGTDAGTSDADLFRQLPSEARDLKDMQWKHRPVLLFAPSEDSADYTKQMALFRQAEAALAERDMVVLSDVEPQTPSPIRQAFSPGGFKLVLVGKDGGVKLEKDMVLSPEELFAVIDRMPMRQREMSE